MISAAPTSDNALARDVLAHLDAQLLAAKRLLQIVLAQGEAIRDRDVQRVVAHAGELQVELEGRGQLERNRLGLLERAAVPLGVTADAVTLEHMTQLMDPESAVAARERSARLRGLLEEIRREHTLNRALMQQELAFLDHLLHLIEADGVGAYDPDGTRGGGPATEGGGARSMHRVLDLEA